MSFNTQYKVSKFKWAYYIPLTHKSLQQKLTEPHFQKFMKPVNKNIIFKKDKKESERKRKGEWRNKNQPKWASSTKQTTAYLPY